ncbi:hypothetical protein RclHR1_00070013 [Rhizophagus clarus]|uniref:Uncharacterized protein n=1 Tax=Rhizophagus clarus TaxID=94130 RepID=A0A2Z6RUE1_9GLOM|nr:hypothetical protein RclHR1_00070013 [Rhizophagus clarus]GES78186.1 hypothetical protein GLOIN_2v1839368 [Rhizophagus clarus]
MTLMTDQKREHVFLDSSDPLVPNQVFLDDPISPSIIKLPFPPQIDPYKLVSNRKQDGSMGRIPARTPNAFILYRKVFIESAHKVGYHLPMTVISTMASKSWKHESDIVKEEYRKISKQAYEIRKQLIPKSSKKKKRERWNFVSFSSKSNLNDNSSKIVMKTFVDKDIQQQKDLIETFNPNLEATNQFPSTESSSDNFDNETVSYTKGQLNYHTYDQKPVNYTNLEHKDIEFESFSHNNNMYDVNQYNLYNVDGMNYHSAGNSNSSIQISHYNFQSFYNYNM